MIEYQKENKEHGRVHVDRKQDNLLRRYILWARVWADRSLLQVNPLDNGLELFKIIFCLQLLRGQDFCTYILVAC